ncbi:ATP-dependent helicase [Candidatus Berkelbacteria bacterium CG10_big_fil_rev_8_21_14_0_10_43_14]|uniref:ATP-dependent helicase n=1 Tax=Candidatus Berkelbacteria bacterium CG10_big_fil_rev_8_21_14_0_10_43_14 TaxID=1974515 RepID=A0A2M6RA46_9BACT|nr:MAG: ATP-dependent helicase [Candidatus Berkelbacteria bacterium CG10_big_fil_rev_8_21_14_0_10_43_14]
MLAVRFIVSYTLRKNNSPQRSLNSRPRFQGRRNYVNPGLRIDINRFVNRAQSVTSEDLYSPIHQFSDFAIDPILKRNIEYKKYISPTPIQDQVIPHVLDGKDVIGIANTGTGKTAAFLIPLMNTLVRNKSDKVLIMVPTRELAQQIQSELFSFNNNLYIKSAVCIGGANIRAQMRDLRNNPSFVIGTPGRLKDLIERKVLYLGNFKTVVLDEADRMLDMGFIHDMKEILSLMPTPRQTLLFSATLSPKIEQLTKQFQTNPVKVSVKTRETLEHVAQDIVHVAHQGQKIDVLHNLLTQPDFEKVLIFGETKHGVQELSNALNVRGHKSTAIHGNKNQNARQKALQQFKRNEIRILVATDVAARGLDIPHVSHVINFDIPASYDDYVHRIGRTGRAGNPGKALTFVR